MIINFAAAKLKISLALLIVLFGTIAAFSQSATPFSINDSPLPAPTSPVNDYAGVFDPASKQQLEKKLIDYKTKTGVELAVAVVKTTGDRDIFDYSLAVARGWKIGSKDLDNPSGLLFIAVDDRKYYSQISKDLEDELPDGVVGSLQRQYLVPEFRKGNYSKGITDTIDAYIATIDAKRSGTAPPPAATQKRDSSGSPGGLNLFCCLIVLGIILLIIWSNRGGGGKSNNDRNRWGGGFGSGLGGALPWIIGSAISGGSGSSSSGNWGSSSSGSSWGGFGGGGDFGGGGAGGSW